MDNHLMHVQSLAELLTETEWIEFKLNNQLPAPKIEIYQESTKITLFAHIPFAKMTHEDKIRACYQHASLKQVMNEQMTNSSLRERFGLQSSNASAISRLIKDAVDEGVIKPFEPNTAPKHMKYVPYWA